MITITNLRDLDKLIAQRLGYVEYIWEEECSQYSSGANWVNGSDYFALTCSTYIPKELYDKTDEEWEADYQQDKSTYSSLEDYISSTCYCLPYFSTSYEAMEEVLNYLNEQDLHIELIRTKGCSICLLSKSSQLYPDPNYMDSFITIQLGKSINPTYNKHQSLPLAVSLAFLKYKNISINLQLEN